MEQRTGRIEALADGVFAIAMTLLVLDLKVPINVAPGELFNSVSHLAPQFIAYAVSFMVLAVYWIGHHNQFHLIIHSDRTLLWINMFFMMSIAFLPFSTGLLASYNDETTAVVLYGSNVIFSGLALYAHWVYASGKGKLIKEGVPERIISITKFRILIGVVFYVVTTSIAFISTKVSLILFAALPFVYMIPSKVDSYFKKSD
jgi:uncharacterized membrane protein